MQNTTQPQTPTQPISSSTQTPPVSQSPNAESTQITPTQPSADTPPPISVDTKKSNSKKPLIVGGIIGLLIILLGGVIFAYQNFFTNQTISLDEPGITNTQNYPIKEETVSNNETGFNQNEEIAEKDAEEKNLIATQQVYKVELKSEYDTPLHEVKQSILELLNLKQYLSPPLEGDTEVAYSVLDEDTELKKYFLLIVADVEEKEYVKNKFSIKVSKESNDLIPYLSDSKYCSDNSDCQIRFSYCANGAFNQYDSVLVPLGCGLPSFEGLEGDKHPENMVNKDCLEYRVEYEGTSCEQNKCVAINPKIVCPK